MKYGVLAVSKGVDNKINIGDYIQALASAQYLPQIDKYTLIPQHYYKIFFLST